MSATARFLGLRNVPYDKNPHGPNSGVRAQSLACFVVLFFAAAGHVPTEAAGPSYVTTVGDYFVCDTLDEWRRNIARFDPESTSDRLAIEGCTPIADGLRATVLSRGTDYVQIRIIPSDEPAFTVYTSPENISRPGIDKFVAINAALQHIPAATGQTVYNRLQACGIRIERDPSWMETATSDYPNIHASAGDVIIELLIDVPPIPGDDPQKYKGVLARWVIKHNKSQAESNWANSLQNKPAPISSKVWMNC